MEGIDVAAVCDMQINGAVAVHIANHRPPWQAQWTQGEDLHLIGDCDVENFNFAGHLNGVLAEGQSIPERVVYPQLRLNNGRLDIFS